MLPVLYNKRISFREAVWRMRELYRLKIEGDNIYNPRNNKSKPLERFVDIDQHYENYFHRETGRPQFIYPACRFAACVRNNAYKIFAHTGLDSKYIKNKCNFCFMLGSIRFMGSADCVLTSESRKHERVELCYRYPADESIISLCQFENTKSCITNCDAHDSYVIIEKYLNNLLDIIDGNLEHPDKDGDFWEYAFEYRDYNRNHFYINYNLVIRHLLYNELEGQSYEK